MKIDDIEYLGINGIPINKIPANACEKNTGSWRIGKPVIDYDKCKSCKICFVFCPDVAIDWIDNCPKINYRICKGCAICIQECPAVAIAMIYE